MAKHERKTTLAAARSRDREATQRGILEAAMAALAEEGFEALGVNGVARRAGCDKQLIYRYFGGLEGLVDAIGSAVAARFADSLERASEGTTFTCYTDMVERMVLALLEAYRDDPVLRRIAAWELAAPSPLTRRLAAARSRPLQAWATKLRGDLQPPKDADSGATNALLIGAVQQLALAAASTGSFSGVALRTDADWTRVREALSALVRRAYGSA